MTESQYARFSTAKAVALTFLTVIAAGQFVMRDYLIRVGAPHSILDSLFATFGLFKLSLPNSNMMTEIPASVQTLRIIAPLTTASSLIAALHKGAVRSFNLATTNRWKGHRVVIGSTELCLLLAKTAVRIGGQSTRKRTVLIAESMIDEKYRELHRLGIRVCLLDKDSPLVKKVIRHAGSVSIDNADDELSVEWAWRIRNLFEHDAHDEPLSTTVYVENTELVRLGNFFSSNRYSIVAKNARLAAEALQIAGPTRGPRGPLNLLIVSDEPAVGSLVLALTRQHVRLGEAARITLIGPLMKDDLDHRGDLADDVLFQVQIDSISESQIVADWIRRLIIRDADSDFAAVASPIYIWTRQMGVAALLVPDILKIDGQRVVVIGTSESSRALALRSAGETPSAGRISVVTREYLMTNEILDVVPDQELIALGLHSFHREKMLADSTINGGFIFPGYDPSDWEHCTTRNLYFDLAKKCLEALSVAEVSLQSSNGRQLPLSNETLIRIAQHLAKANGIPFDLADNSDDGIKGRYQILEVVSLVTTLFGVGTCLVEKTSGVALDESIVDLIAMNIHMRYQAAEAERTDSEVKSQSPNALLGWDALSVRARESNLEQARSISLKLAALGVALRREQSPDCSWNSGDLPNSTVETLAEIEHWRWCDSLLMRGFVRGDARDDVMRTHPDLCPYTSLSDESREKDRRAIRSISDLLLNVGLHAYQPD